MSEYKLVPVEPTQEMIDAAREHHEGEAYLPVSVYKAMLAAAPAVQGEPAGWQFYQDGKWWNGDDRIKDHKKNTQEAGFRVRDVYAYPQPVEQQPDVALLLELLSHARCNTCDGSGGFYDSHAQVHQCQWCHERSEALVAYRKQGGEV